MKLSRNKTMATLIALFLVLTITATLVALPIANAHTPAWTIPTYAYVTASPSTVGVGQYTLIVVSVDKYPPTAGGMGGDRWHGYKLDITKPDGSKETIGPWTETSCLGSDFVQYIPDQVGDYSIVFSWPGQTLTNGTGVPNTGNQQLDYVGDYFEGSTSDPFILHVQQEPIVEWVEPPLPTDYWNRPINAANREWSTLASNWLGGSWLVNNFQPSGQAPTSAHIVWTRPAFQGGISDARWPGQIVGGQDYLGVFSAPIIMNGVVYLNTQNNVEMEPAYGYCALDLRTGEQLFYKNGTDNGLNNPVTLVARGSTGLGLKLHQSFPTLSFGQLYHYYSENGQGILPYLWMTVGSTWYMLDASTGNWIMTLKNVPGGTAVTDQDGSLLRYSYNGATGQFLCWNSSQSIPPAGPTGTNQQQFRPITGATIDAVNDTIWTNYGPSGTSTSGVISPWYASDILPRSGYTMNVTGPKGLPALNRVLQDENRVPKLMMFTKLYGYGQTLYPGYVLGTNEQRFEVAVVQINEHVAPYSPMPDKTNTQNNNLGFGVTLLWDKNFTYPLGGNRTFGFGPVSYEDKVFTLYCTETRQWFGYSLDNGALLWGPTPSQGVWDYYLATPYSGSAGGNYAYGKLYSCYYAGTLYAYDIKTGKLLWTYNATNIGHESPYGNYPLNIGAICDGKIYLYSTEHTPTVPPWRGAYLRCINATDGTEMWKLLYFMGVGGSGMGIADGYLVAAGSIYDNQIYCIGKGPSATTVEAPMTAITAGSSVVIQGTVTDQSPGAKGTPAIADADMEAWMEYLYEQQAMPTTAKGVEVTLDAVDPNGNFIHIGTTTNDISGTFGYAWTTPDVPGKYTIIATFAGSESYGSSYAETYTVVSEAPATPTPPPAAAPLPPFDLYIIGTGIAIIIAVAIVGILLLRKRP
jgi:outer membrane protein assembly factor BamB